MLSVYFFFKGETDRKLKCALTCTKPHQHMYRYDYCSSWFPTAPCQIKCLEYMVLNVLLFCKR